jgi:hypothetical protein
MTALISDWLDKDELWLGGIELELDDSVDVWLFDSTDDCVEI